VWEPVWGVDAWIALGIAATRTRTIRLGTMLTPPSRRRPWELAGQVATVDRLSGGRVTVSVGLGAIDSGFEAFGEECDRRRRAELMDECLEIVTGLWQGQPYSFDGRHYQVRPTQFPTLGSIVQSPRVPVWCVGALGRPKSMARALRWDGVIPQVIGTNDDGTPDARQPNLDEIRALRAEIDADPDGRHRDIVVEGTVGEHSPAAYAAAGATWWIESMWDAVGEASPVDAARDRLAEGPPR
jgi:alkanesulfonate monooxygenase SsuD/methylene tetrahydromethanopterin reductase-like flavin-dependent oxidoreductase (luciferase family)